MLNLILLIAKCEYQFPIQRENLDTIESDILDLFAMRSHGHQQSIEQQLLPDYSVVCVLEPKSLRSRCRNYLNLPTGAVVNARYKPHVQYRRASLHNQALVDLDFQVAVVYYCPQGRAVEDPVLALVVPAD